VTAGIFVSLLLTAATGGWLGLSGACPCDAGEVAVEGKLVVWYPITLSFQGPEAAETDRSPNPFLDMRLQVAFTGPSSQRYDVHGFFDGDAHGGTRGRVWRVRFSPDSPGIWRYEAFFRVGDGVAIRLERDAGEPMELANPAGSFVVSEREPDAPGFLKWGRLAYVGQHYLKFQDGPYWLRGGTDEPENLLAYAGFDRTHASHHFAAHVADWRDGDPDWGGGKGRGIIGALNYLASQHVNSIYFLTMNVGGDGQDVWPWTIPLDARGSPNNDNLHFDIGKLEQWEVVLDHAQRLGIFLHFVLNEGEEANKRELDNGELGPERKLYYRELIARFGHHLALEWNLCEEYNLNFNFGAERIRAFADYIRAVDPYDHPVTVHSAGDPVEQLRFTFGDPRFALTSVQLNQRPIHEVTEAIRHHSRQARRPLPVSLDEFTLDRGQRASHLPVDDAEGHRREKLWPTYLSGGMIEFILEDLLQTDSFKTPEREKLWRYVWHARRFMEENLPFWEMEPADELSEGAGTISVGIGQGRSVPMGPQVFAKRGEVYAIFLPTGSPSGTLDLRDMKGPAEQRWFNPRRGEFAGEKLRIEGGTRRALGVPPMEHGSDWVVLFRRMANPVDSARRFPGERWESRRPDEVGMNTERLDEFVERMGGDGCIVRDGYLVQSWGRIDAHHDWASAAKPVLSTLLLLAVQEGRLSSVDALVKDVGWPLSEKDASMTFRHLANMVSGYARAEAPGEAWAYNDVAIQLYARSLEKVFQEPLDRALRTRLAALQFEDGEFLGSRQGLGVIASPRDVARLGWLWLNGGEWNGQQILSAELMKDCFRASVPPNLPRTKAAGEDYLGVGSFGGGTNQTKNGPGIYGFNFWFNRPHSTGERAWPRAPEDMFQANGKWNLDTVTIIPSLRMVVAVRGAKTDERDRDDPFRAFDQKLQPLIEAADASSPPRDERTVTVD